MSKINFYPTMGLSPYTGYGRMSLGLAKGLQSAGVEVLLYPQPAYPTLVIGYAPALEAPHIRTTRRWAFTMLESDKPNAELVAALNAHCERVLVPAPPLADLFREHGVTRPIDFVPLGVDLFPVTPRTEMPQRATFTFVTYSYGEMRKGADLVVRVFERVFGADARYHLLIKAREGYQMGWLADIQHPRIQIIGGQQSEEDWQRLLLEADCFVYPTRAEGWGMPPRDATLAGIPTIATAWLGLWDIEQWGLPVLVSHLRPTEFRNNPFNASDANWAEPDIEELEAKMIWVTQNYGLAKRIALAGRGYLLRKYSWQKVGEQLKELLQTPL